MNFWTDVEIEEMVKNGKSITKFLKEKNLANKYYKQVKKDLVRLGFEKTNLHKNVKREKKIVWTKEMVEEVVKRSYGFVECIRNLTGRKYKCGGDIKRLKKCILDYNIDISHFPPQHIRTSVGTKKFKPPISSKNIFVSNSKFNPKTVHDRYMAINLPQNCCICGINEWNKKPITLQLDHVNGNNKDCRIENLRWLCPNCHSQTETYTRGMKKKINFPDNKHLLEMNKTMNCTEIAKLLNTSASYVSKKICLAKLQ